MGQLDGKTALVAGASTGIGLAVARRFATEGATAYLTGRRKAALDTTVAQVGSRGIGIRSDVSQLDDLDRLFAEITERSGSLDIVVASAGVGDDRPLGKIAEKEYVQATSINLKGTIFTVQKALPLLSAGASVTRSSRRGRCHRPLSDRRPQLLHRRCGTARRRRRHPALEVT